MIENLELKLVGELPIDRKELFELIDSWGRKENYYTEDDITVKRSNPSECYDLSNLDVSKIDDFSYIFCNSMYNRDLSKWDVSNVTNMDTSFCNSDFNNDSLKDWNTSNVEDMSYLFYGSIFNGDLSNWNLSNVKKITSIFNRSDFNNNSINYWDVSNILDFIGAFAHSAFCGDLSSWKFNKDAKLISMFQEDFNFEEKYNNSTELPYHSIDMIEWFEENRNKMKELNQASKEEVLDFFDFNNNLELKENYDN